MASQAYLASRSTCNSMFFSIRRRENRAHEVHREPVHVLCTLAAAAEMSYNMQLQDMVSPPGIQMHYPLFDMSHVPFAHHGLLGTGTRDIALPLNSTTTLAATPTGGFEVVTDSGPFKTAEPIHTVNYFKPPVLNCMSQTNTVKGATLVLTFYGIPIAPGKSRVIMAFFTNAKVPSIAMKAAAAFEWVFHLVQHEVLDSNAMLLHVQERLLHAGRDPNWRTAFYMPAPADAGVVQFRRWYHDCAGGDIPWPDTLKDQGLGPVKPREVVMDRYSQHVVNCKSCSTAVKWIQRLQAASLALAGLAAAACMAAVTAAAVAASSTAAAAVSGNAFTAVAGVIAAVPSWQCAVLGVAAVALLVVHHKLADLKQRFFFVD